MADPILVAIAAALAGKAAGALASGGSTAFGRLYRLVKEKLSGREEDAGLLDDAASAPDSKATVARLADAMEHASTDDPAFAAQLRELWGQARTELRADRGGVINEVTGNVSGNVIQARDIQGNISLGGPPRDDR